MPKITTYILSSENNKKFGKTWATWNMKRIFLIYVTVVAGNIIHTLTEFRYIPVYEQVHNALTNESHVRLLQNLPSSGRPQQ